MGPKWIIVHRKGKEGAKMLGTAFLVVSNMIEPWCTDEKLPSMFAVQIVTDFWRNRTPFARKVKAALLH